MDCYPDDTWKTIGDFQFAGHEGTLFVRSNRDNVNYNKWIDDFKIKDYSTCRTDRLGKHICFYGACEKPSDISIKCLSYYPVDDWTDLGNALYYFHECGLYVKLTARELSKLIDFVGLSTVEMLYDNREKGFDRYKFLKNYGYFRHQVLERDNHKCVNCGETSNLEVHHIYSFKNHLELGDDVSNGITLCKSCHQEYHNIYGYDSNPIDLINFIKNISLDEFLEELCVSSMLKSTFKAYAQSNNLKFASEDKFYEIYDEFLNIELVVDNNDS